MLLDLFFVNGSAIADLNHIAINSAMNIQGLTDNEPTIQEECGKIINAVRVFSKHYRQRSGCVYDGCATNKLK
jgi:hypothetical protein